MGATARASCDHLEEHCRQSAAIPRLERSEVVSLGLYARQRAANVLRSFLREQAPGLPDDIMITGITLLVLGRDLG